MATKKSKTEFFNSEEKNLWLEHGKMQDEKSRKFIKDALGVTGRLVEATRHTILSGPPGVGKSYGTIDECVKANVKYITVAPGMTDLQLALKLAAGVADLLPHETLIVIMDDSDDVVFGSYEALNKWKIAMGDIDYDLGIIPFYHYPASMLSTLSQLEKAGKTKLVNCIKSWQNDTDIGLSIPMDRVRFLILCNLDLENPKAFRSAKIRSAVEPVLDRFNYKRMDLDENVQWGWLSYVLINSQPFDEYPLTADQKKILLDWMKMSWPLLRSTSYRTVRKLAAAMINEPNNYEDLWKNELKGN